MRKLLTLAVLLALATVALAAPAAAQTQPTTKWWLCHKTGSTFTTSAGSFMKYTAIRVSGRALMRAHLRHGDVAVSPAPTGNLAAQRRAARTACAALRVPAPITPARGGVALNATLSGGGVTANLTVRTQVGQRRVCFTLNITGPSGATFSLSSLTLAQGSTTISFPSSQLTGSNPTGCITLTDRDIAKQLLDGSFLATLSGTVTPAGGSASSFQATGNVSR